MAANAPRSSPGLLTQLRSQHWAVKLILVIVALSLGSPVIAGVAAVAYEAAGPLAVMFVLGAILAGVGWFISPSARAGQVTSLEAFRYCESCGARFTVDTCPACHTTWTAPQIKETPAALARFLNLITAEYEAHRVDSASFKRISNEYLARLDAVLARRRRPAPAPAAAVQPPAPAPRPAVRPAGVAAGSPPLRSARPGDGHGACACRATLRSHSPAARWPTAPHLA
jgi:hypothetical protein